MQRRAKVHLIRQSLSACLLLAALVSVPAKAVVCAIGTDMYINDVAQLESNSGTTIFSFTVTRGSSCHNATFEISTADDTAATAGSDYVAKSLAGQTFADSSLTYIFSVEVLGDLTVESDETFFVNLTNVVPIGNMLVSDGQGVGTITNDDAPPTSGLVAEPATLALLGVGLAGLGFSRRKQ